MHECDVLIAIGARFDDRVTGQIAQFCPDATIIHIDIDPASIAKNVRVDVPIVGDVRAVLKDMIALLKRSDHRPDQLALKKWWDKIEQWRKTDCLRYDRNSKLIKPQHVVEKIYERTNGDAYVTSDVG